MTTNQLLPSFPYNTVEAYVGVPFLQALCFRSRNHIYNMGHFYHRTLLRPFPDQVSFSRMHESDISFSNYVKSLRYPDLERYNANHKTYGANPNKPWVLLRVVGKEWELIDHANFDLLPFSFSVTI